MEDEVILAYGFELCDSILRNWELGLSTMDLLISQHIQIIVINQNSMF